MTDRRAAGGRRQGLPLSEHAAQRVGDDVNVELRISSTHF